MLSKGFKIISPKTFEIDVDTVKSKIGNAIVKVDYIAVCKADLRYYLGKRDERILGLKYPMRLIHEATGTILKDNTGKFKVGDKVVLVPNICECDNCDFNCKDNEALGENYCPKAKFASSNYDGFSCECLSYPSKNMVKLDNEKYSEKYVFLELISVAVAAIRRVDNINGLKIGVWGDGILGYILSNTLKVLFPESKVYCIGNNEYKLNKFNIDGTYLVNSAELNKEVFDLCFECVGGNAAENAINQIIEKCKFGGDIVLTGVSENGALINTRRILEKAVRITGTTRSTVRDFKTAVDLIENTNLLDELERLVLSTNEVNDISAYYSVFEKEVENRELGKHIMKLNL
ncbi:MAG: alcohol dehydrogenase catalytic domain-containing protein [Clostridium saudiense]|uniref:alcohol dehydrogenase catalytic domain-containing protein n=1 Tax=Clostridium saudiense TaxID=1414720 RepID=UPI0012B7E798|nr:alcohol dehydrogenase catalytic domain-containing protein [uncultured Clostridium sp.]MEE0725427.1 alcohol dehydrogenase catalytic domain-containing protein [Clostridium saudiense]